MEQLEKGCHSSLTESARAFVHWMNLNNFDLHPNVQLRHVNSYQSHSVIANGPIDEDAKLFQVPKECTLSWSTSSLKKLLPKLKLPGWNNLILAMMFEDSQKNSFWRSYLDILPSQLNTPLFWSQPELELLKGTAVASHIGASKIASDYKKYIVPALAKPELYSNIKLKNPTGSAFVISRSKPSAEEIEKIKQKHFSFDQYRRFGSLIMAYSFTFDDGEIAMVPMADMLNHKTGYNNARLFFDQEDDSIDKTEPEEEQETLTTNSNSEKAEPAKKKHKKSESANFLHMRTRRAIQPEEELFNTYGTLPDSELLRKYGYVEDLGKNRWNDVDIPISTLLKVCSQKCGWEAKEVQKRMQFIKQRNLVDLEDNLMFYMPQEPFGPCDPAEAEEAVTGGLTKDIIALCKIFAASPDEWALAEKSITEATSNQAPDDESDSDMESEDEDEEEENNLEEKAPDATEESNQKKGGDLIQVSDTAKLYGIVASVFEARLSEYADREISGDLAELEQIPAPSSPLANLETRRKQAALVLRIGEKQILHKLLEETRSLASV